MFVFVHISVSSYTLHYRDYSITKYYVCVRYKL
nr:MAG TPA: hypothetical protein [Caudoviricetes sp.]